MPAPPTEPDTICVVPIDAQVDSDALVWRLVHDLAHHGPVAVMADDGAVLQSEGPNLGPIPPTRPDAPHRQWARRLDELESEHPWVVLHAPDPQGNPAWASFCLRSADRTLAVTRGGTVAELGHRPHRPPQGRRVFARPIPEARAMAPVIESLSPRALHHLPGGPAFRGGRRPPRPPRQRPLARRRVLRGRRPRAGARRRLRGAARAAGAPIDRVGGCSAGAVRRRARRRRPHAGRDDRDLPRGARRAPPVHRLHRAARGAHPGHKTMAMLTRVFGDARIEELALSMFAVSADLGDRAISSCTAPGWCATPSRPACAIPGFAPAGQRRARPSCSSTAGCSTTCPSTSWATTREGPVVAVDVMREFPIPDAGAPTWACRAGSSGAWSVSVRASCRRIARARWCSAGGTGAARPTARPPTCS